MTREERIQTVNVAVRALFQMPEYPTAIRTDACLHCEMMKRGEGAEEKGKEFCAKLTLILKENGVNPQAVVEAARRGGVTNFSFENGEILVPLGIRRFLTLEPLWHRMLSFDFLMEIVQEHTSG